MTFGLARMVLGSTAFAAISHTQYERIRDAKAALFQTLFIEEKFDIVVENLIELETELLDLTTRYMVGGFRGYVTFQTGRNLLNRRIVNLLTATRLYLDHMSHHLGDAIPNDRIGRESIKDFVSSQYDKHLSYRVMEALRNYVQHRGVPIHSVTYNRGVIDSPVPEHRVRHEIVPYISPKELARDGKFKAETLKELRVQGDPIELKPIIREYIDCIGQIHNKVREVLEPHITGWENDVHSAIEMFKAQFPNESSLIGLAAISREESGQVIDETPLFTEHIEYQRQLREKNPAKVILSRNLVTSASW